MLGIIYKRTIRVQNIHSKELPEDIRHLVWSHDIVVDS